jgi:hypothetical protein
MNDTPVTADDRRRNPGAAMQEPAPAGPHRLRLELIMASVWLAVGLFVLPAVIYAVGILLLGPYGDGQGGDGQGADGQGLGHFYTDFFADLAGPTARTWLLALGPLVLVTLIRVIFLGLRAKSDGATASHEPRSEPAEKPRAASREQARVEPRIGPG